MEVSKGLLVVYFLIAMAYNTFEAGRGTHHHEHSRNDMLGGALFFGVVALLVFLFV